MSKSYLYLATLSATLILSYLLLNSYNFQINPTGKFVYTEDSAVSVNGERITAKDVEELYSKLPDELKGNLTKDQVLDGLINRTLLLQEAEMQGINVTDSEVEDYLGKIQSFGGDRNGLGYTTEEYKAAVKDRLTIWKLLDKVLGLQDTQLTDAEVEAFIQKNREAFKDIFSEGDPTLEEIFRTRVKQKLVLEKQQETVNAYIESLKGRSDIVEVKYYYKP